MTTNDKLQTIEISRSDVPRMREAIHTVLDPEVRRIFGLVADACERVIEGGTVALTAPRFAFEITVRA